MAACSNFYDNYSVKIEIDSSQIRKWNCQMNLDDMDELFFNGRSYFMEISFIIVLPFNLVFKYKYINILVFRTLHS